VPDPVVLSKYTSASKSDSLLTFLLMAVLPNSLICYVLYYIEKAANQVKDQLRHNSAIRALIFVA
jgi:hypothetical protein